jgi:hypothetical protein
VAGAEGVGLGDALGEPRHPHVPTAALEPAPDAEGEEHDGDEPEDEAEPEEHDRDAWRRSAAADHGNDLNDRQEEGDGSHAPWRGIGGGPSALRAPRDAYRTERGKCPAADAGSSGNGSRRYEMPYAVQLTEHR